MYWDASIERNFSVFKFVLKQNMTASFTIRKSELSEEFIEMIKKTFKSDRILIKIEEELDETESISQNQELYNKILVASHEMEDDLNVIRYEGNSFSEKFNPL